MLEKNENKIDSMYIRKYEKNIFRESVYSYMNNKLTVNIAILKAFSKVNT